MLGSNKVAGFVSLLLSPVVLAAPAELIRVKGLEASYSRDTVQNRCVLPGTVVKDEPSELSAYGKLQGTSNGTWWYQLCKAKEVSDLYRRHPYNQNAVFIFKAEEDRFVPIYANHWYESGGMNFFEEPSAIVSGGRNVIWIKNRFTGTGALHEDELLDVTNGQVQLLDTKTWLDDLKKRLPPGREIWKGVYPDYSKMRLEIRLWAKGDGNCCPTGGTAIVDLEWKDNALAIKSFRYVELIKEP